MRGVFVAGTDTGVGKTVVACALVRALRARGMDACGMKPVETGVTAAGPLDALALRAAAGDTEPLDLVCPQRFAMPAAPSVAAEAELRAVDLAAIERAFAELAARHALVVVEGAGGLRVPLTPVLDMAGLAERLDLPVLLVARGALGTINHTLLSLDLLRARGNRIAGVVVSHGPAPLSDADAANLDALRRELGALRVGEIPSLRPGAMPADDALDLDALLRAIDPGRRP